LLSVAGLSIELFDYSPHIRQRDSALFNARR
jgi:hypothetical protein